MGMKILILVKNSQNIELKPMILPKKVKMRIFMKVNSPKERQRKKTLRHMVMSEGVRKIFGILMCM